KALANDTYHPEANYIFGLVSKELGKKYDALDAFSMAARSVSYKSVANAQIAAIWFMEGELQKCLKYAAQALDYNRYNMNALKMKALLYEKTNELQNRNNVLDEILRIDPLNSFARFEKKEDFNLVLNYEMPDQICLELAIWYHILGLNEKAVQVLKMTNATPLINYWLSYILKDSELLNKAISASTAFVFPFRRETLNVLEWAQTQNNSWKTKYYLGLIYWSKGRINEAQQHFRECENQPDYFAFYLTRFELLNGEPGYNGEADLKKAWDLNQNEWRCYKALSDYYGDNQNFTAAIDWAQKGFVKFPGDYILAYQFAKNLLIAGKYEESLNILTKTTILPNEGASAGRVTYRQDCIMDAVAKIKNNKNKAALARITQARKWPENLGVGKPYDTDERIEDYLESLVWNKTGKTSKAKELEDKIVDYTQNSTRLSSSVYLGAILLKKTGKQDEAKKLLTNWAEKQPNSKVAGWCLAKFNGENEQAENILNEIKNANGGTLFNARTVDSEFPLIQAISEIN
ncbi:MAG TPA: hypothetical protein VLA03_02170, partial [Draconibacterium sp.]|nr:hypothetical protein [Draconibacterium sp.]